LVEHVGKELQAQRAHIGTERITELDQHQLAAELGVAALFAVLVGELERAADTGPGDAGPRSVGEEVARADADPHAGDDGEQDSDETAASKTEHSAPYSA